MCYRNGFLVNENLVYANSYLNSYSNHNHKLKELLNSLAEGRNITLPELAATLELISSNGVKGILIFFSNLIHDRKNIFLFKLF